MVKTGQLRKEIAFESLTCPQLPPKEKGFSMDIIQRHPRGGILAATFGLSITGLALSPGGGPSFIPSTALLTAILIYTKSHEIQTYLTQWIVLTLSITISHSGASLSALSSPFTSILMLSIMSSVSALFALIPVYLSHLVSQHLPTHRLIIFPTLWTFTWLCVSQSPIGRLLTWTPLTGTLSYDWILPIIGLPGLDFICASWANVAAECISTISGDDGLTKDVSLVPDLVSITDGETPAVRATATRGSLISSATILLALTLPSFYFSSLPPPPYSDIAENTPLNVACILPPPDPSSSKSQLDQFIKESKKFDSTSNIMLWPEGAVTFENEAEKAAALSSIREQVFRSGNPKLWVGVSFLQRIEGDKKMGTRDGMYRNGMMLVGEHDVEFTYYKRHLVPIAESFAQLPSNVEPPLHTIQLPHPNGIPKDDWKTPRPITLTASICLDFASPIFPSGSNTLIPGNDDATPVRPSLILAPARTWDTRIGEAMHSLARARAQELGAELLWCDGGAGGLSGVGNDIQVGWGSWVKTIGVPYHADDPNKATKPTIYAIAGDYVAIFLLLNVWGAATIPSFWGSAGRAALPGVLRIRQRIGDIRTRLRERITGRRPPVPLLIQIDEDEEERLI